MLPPLAVTHRVPAGSLCSPHVAIDGLDVIEGNEGGLLAAHLRGIAHD